MATATATITEAGQRMLAKFCHPAWTVAGTYRGRPVSVLRIKSWNGAEIATIEKLKRDGLVISSRVPGGRNVILTSAGQALVTERMCAAPKFLNASYVGSFA